MYLHRLRDLALLAMKGSGSRTYYFPGARFATPASGRDDPAAGGAVVTSLEADSHHPGTDGHQWLATIPAGLRARLPAPGNSPPR